VLRENRPVRDEPNQAARQAIVFSAGVVVYLWVRDQGWSLFLLVVLVVYAVWILRQQGGLTPADLGLGWGAGRAGLRQWRTGLAVSCLVTVLVMNRRLADGALWVDGLWYGLWALIQQLVYQNVVAQPLCEVSRRGCWWAGALFAAAHLPNPVLVPATFGWGVTSCRMYQRIRSVFVLALFQAILASGLYWLVPVDWHRGFRVGISYLKASQSFAASAPSGAGAPLAVV